MAHELMNDPDLVPVSDRDMAEIELGALCHQCLARRIPDMGTMHTETPAWERERNRSQTPIDWHLPLWTPAFNSWGSIRVFGCYGT